MKLRVVRDGNTLLETDVSDDAEVFVSDETEERELQVDPKKAEKKVKVRTGVVVYIEVPE
jgi:hypothetical protein